MANARSPPYSRHTSREGESQASKYIGYIKRSFVRQGDSSLYYKQLLDYLESDVGHGSSLLQTPRYYELERGIAPSGEGRVYNEIAPGSARHHPSIAVLEGFPSPKSIGIIGASEMVRPELFIGHLDFSRSISSSRRFFELPSLPSDRSNAIHIRLPTLGTSVMGETALKSHVHSRIQADEKCIAFESQLFRGKHFGATRFRKVHLHNSQMFSLEQMVSFSVTQRENEPWCGIYLIDRGKSLVGRHNLPWSNYTGGGRRNPSFVPIVTYNNFGLEAIHMAPDQASDGINLHPYHPVNDLSASDDSEFELLRQEPFFLLSRLFLLAARSWSQLLNFVEQDIQSCSIVGEDLLSPALEQLRFNSDLLERVRAFLTEDQHVVRERGAPAWPKTSEPALNAKVLSVQTSLDTDYSFLIHRCERLVTRCENSSSILVSAEQLLEAQKGIGQAQEIRGLTKLAFVFIPLTFVAGLFGMNVSEFQGNPSIWIYFVVAVPLTVLSWFASETLLNGGSRWFGKLLKQRGAK